MLIRSKAPLRISFAGGGTDVPPYVEERGGVVLNATVDKYAYGTLRVRNDRYIRIRSLDYGLTEEYHLDDDLDAQGSLPLIKAVIRTIDRHHQCGLDILIHSDAPPGSGLGSSSTMVVALIGLLAHWQRLPLSNYDIARLAYRIERQDMGIQGGMQDQYAAAFGGFNFMEFDATSVTVNPLRIDQDTINELEYNLLLCYTGGTRLSAKIIQTQIDNYLDGKFSVIRALDELKAITLETKKALLHGRLDDFGKLLHDGWLNKKRLARQISNPKIDALYDVARAHGTLGGKLLGAGGGGYLLLYCQSDCKHTVAKQLEHMGGKVVDFTFDRRGLQTWEVQSAEERQRALVG